MLKNIERGNLLQFREDSGLNFFNISFRNCTSKLRFSLPGSSWHYFFILQFRFMKFIHTLKNLVSIWSSGSSRSSQSSQKMFRRSGRSYGNATQTIANDPDDWDDLDRLDRVEFYPDDRDDHVNFEAIIWKRSQTTETIGTIEGYPRSHHFYSSNRE